jgi:hypothetical protein
VRADDNAAASAWTTRDAWLLLAIGDHRKRACSLSDLIGSADARDHDVPTESECACIIGTLIASGLVEVAKDRYRVTPTGQKIVRSASGELFLQSRRLLPALAEIPRVAGEFIFRDGEFAEAFRAYRRRAKF